MYKIFYFIFFSFVISCTDRHSSILSNSESKDNKASYITAIKSNFPLQLSEIDFRNKNNFIYLDRNIISKIDSVTQEYAHEIEFSDSSMTYRDIYINTIQLRDSVLTIYLVLFKHYPTGMVNTKVLFYDNERNVFIENPHDFNVHAMYNYEKDFLISSNLKNELKINVPEVEKIDFNKDGANDYKFVRLIHNGTYNALQTFIFTFKNKTIDTLFMKIDPIN